MINDSGIALDSLPAFTPVYKPDGSIEIRFHRNIGEEITVSMDAPLQILGEGGMFDHIHKVPIWRMSWVNEDGLRMSWEKGERHTMLPGDSLELFGAVFNPNEDGAEDWHYTASIRCLIGSRTVYLEGHVKLVYSGEFPVHATAGFQLEVQDSGNPRWMVPGMFYKDNRDPSCHRIYPRYEEHCYDAESMTADAWSFRADRCSLPAALVWTDGMMTAISTEETFASSRGGTNQAGVAFGRRKGQTFLRLHFPYTEEPAVFYGFPTSKPADIPGMKFEKGDDLTFRFRMYLAGPELHGYDPFIRSLYDVNKEQHPLNPWMSDSKAAELTAYGLFNWHYKPEYDVLYETIAFDRELNTGAQGKADRPHMHVAWVSGAPYAYSLMRYGAENRNKDYYEAGRRVLNKIASGIAPLGTFWPEWTLENGWGTGWNPKPHWVQARTVSEATLFMIRALSFERNAGRTHPAWETAIRSNLEFACRAQREDGHFGSYYHVETGVVEVWEGAGGLLWIPALVEAAELLGDSRYKEKALLAGQAYISYVEDEYIYGAPEDVHLTATSEDGYNAVMAYMSLYRIDESEEKANWLRCAASAADWTMTFRWSYNIKFPEHSLLARYEYHTRGADNASPANNHLHNYGLVCMPEMLQLFDATGDSYYFERMRDHLLCFLQFIAREDGDFNAYKGMVTERYYNTNCFQPKGMILGLAHTWCSGLILYAHLVLRERGIEMK
ncbi:hypothetical protein [Paenibacillus taihuensis]|nr:hypothetical protein [Paenibacillus taihuensis]